MSDEFPLPEPPSKSGNVYAVELVSGSFGGAAQVIVGQPLDTLKTVRASLYTPTTADSSARKQRRQANSRTLGTFSAKLCATRACSRSTRVRSTQ